MVNVSELKEPHDGGFRQCFTGLYHHGQRDDFVRRLVIRPAPLNVRREMRLGPYDLASNLCLSPLGGYTTLPFPLTLRDWGGWGWVTTDLVNARSLLERNPTALKLGASSPADRPMAIQLFGSVA